MGLLKAGVNAIGTTLHDQWRDLIVCENMDNDTLMMMKTTETGVISKDSLIRVMPGQCAVIINNGKVIDATAESGDYTFDESSSPSFFAGQFGETFKEMWQRFTYGGIAVMRQCVYYFNTKEIIGNKFGTATPIPYQDWSHPIPNQMTGGILPLPLKVKCYGTYTYKIINPAVFLSEIAGTAEIYKKDQLVEQMRSEVMAVFQNVVNQLGNEDSKVPALELPSQTDEIRELMNKDVFDGRIRERGLQIISFNVESVTLDDESNKNIQNYNLSANANLQQGTLTGAYANAVEKAASNPNGVMNGFMGIGMTNMASNGMFGSAISNSNNNSTNSTYNGNNMDNGNNSNNINNGPQSQHNSQTANNNVLPDKENEGIKTESEIWFCTNCGTKNKGKFCMNCGKSKEESAK